MQGINNTLAHALRGLGMKSLAAPVAAHTLEVIIDRHPLMVAVRGLTDDEREKPGWLHAVVQVMLRVDLQSWARLGLETGQELDRWLGSVEPALGSLVAGFEGYAAPFHGHRLAIQQIAPQDPWVMHMCTIKDKWRDSRWLVLKEGVLR